MCARILLILGLISITGCTSLDLLMKNIRNQSNRETASQSKPIAESQYYKEMTAYFTNMSDTEEARQNYSFCTQIAKHDMAPGRMAALDNFFDKKDAKKDCVCTALGWVLLRTVIFENSVKQCLSSLGYQRIRGEGV